MIPLTGEDPTATAHHIAVVDTVSRLGLLTDSRDWDGLLGLFAEAVEVDYTSLNGGVPERLEARQLVTGWATMLGGLDATQHIISNHHVSLNADTAECAAYVQATHLLRGPGDKEPGDTVTWVLGGRYDIRLRILDDSWKITSLRMTAIWSTGDRAIMTLARDRRALAGPAG